MDRLNRMEASMTFKARSIMFQVKNNYETKYSRLSNNKEENQIHVQQECLVLELLTIANHGKHLQI